MGCFRLSLTVLSRIGQKRVFSLTGWFPVDSSRVSRARLHFRLPGFESGFAFRLRSVTPLWISFPEDSASKPDW